MRSPGSIVRSYIGATGDGNFFTLTWPPAPILEHWRTVGPAWNWVRFEKTGDRANSSSHELGSSVRMATSSPFSLRPPPDWRGRR